MSNERPDIVVRHFEGRPVNFRSENGKLSLTMKEAGEALEYKHPSEAISQIYSNHKDEFDNDCTQISISDKRDGSPPRHERVFTLDGLITLCYFSEQPIAKKFRAWLRRVGREVMTTGSYTLPVLQQSQQSIDMKAFAEVVATSMAQALHGFTGATESDFRARGRFSPLPG